MLREAASGNPIAVAQPRRRAGVRARLRHASWQGERIDWSAYLFLLPFFLPFLIFTVAAVGFGAYVSFTEWGVIGDPQWIGLDNFQRALQDSFVPKVWTNTLK